MLNFKSNLGPSLEIDLIVKDAEGNPTPTRKSLSTDSGYKLWEFWKRHQGRPKKKKKKKDVEKLPGAEEASKILKTIFQDEEGDQ